MEQSKPSLPDDIVLSVVVPVYDEEATLEEIVRRIRAVPIRKEIILVDDCSRDSSRETLAVLAGSETPENRIVVVRHERNRGKGAALRTGFSRATGDVLIIQDADLEYDPNEYPRLLQPILDGKADVVYGSRFRGDRPKPTSSFWHESGNRFLTRLSNLFTSLKLSDMETCYKAFRREVIDSLLPTLKEDRFGFEPEITAKIARRKYRVCEVEIGYERRTYQEGKKIGPRDALDAVRCILRYAWRD